MAFDFPASPIVGQQYAPAGGPVYQWNGTAWVVEAPQLFATAESRNRIVNGAMQISQENGDAVSPVVVTAAFYPADQWMIAWNLTGIASAKRYADATLSAGYRIQFNVNTATPSPAAGAYCHVQQPIEGNRLADLKWGTAQAKPLVVRFSVMAIPGTYTLAIRNGALDRSFLAPFTVVAAATWQHFTVVIPGDTTGTWATDNTVGAYITFSLVTGTTYGGGTAGWQAGNKTQIAGASNLAAAVNNYFAVSDVGLYLDPDNTGLPPKWEMPDEAEELRACQRYYQTLAGMGFGFSGNVTTGINYSAMTVFPVPMRTTAAATGVSAANGAFPATTGTLNVTSTGGHEVRIANATANGGAFRSIVTLNARM